MAAGVTRVADVRREYVSEADLSVVWEGQLLARKSLRTEDGQPLRVIYRGLPAGGAAGPDFRDAVVATPQGPRRGDVELHVRASDFRRHGHHENPAYAGIVLHAVFDAEGEAYTDLPGGGSAPLLVVPRPSRRSRGRAAARAWAEPCATAIERLGEEASAAALDRLGEMRFRQKMNGPRERLAAGEARDELVWEGLLEGLAYGADRESFRRLAAVVSWASLAASLRPLAPGEREEAAKESLERALAGQRSRTKNRRRRGSLRALRRQRPGRGAAGSARPVGPAGGELARAGVVCAAADRSRPGGGAGGQRRSAAGGGAGCLGGGRSACRRGVWGAAAAGALRGRSPPAPRAGSRAAQRPPPAGDALSAQAVLYAGRLWPLSAVVRRVIGDRGRGPSRASG
ncbi:MAG: DUF2851 family protein [Chloroflexi bacterium]|nr:DUF2851 family protein [Chloroflexota bacterium]